MKKMKNRQKKSRIRTRKGKKRDEPLVSKEQIMQALEDRLGNVMLAAMDLKCHRTLIYRRMVGDKEIETFQEQLRKKYREQCGKIALDNHQFRLLMGDGDATRYELQKMDPKPQGIHIDTNKLTQEELIELQRLLLKAKPDGAEDASA